MKHPPANEASGAQDGKKASFKKPHSFKNQIISLFVLVVVILFAFIGVFTLMILEPYLRETNAHNQRQMAGALSWEFGNLRGKIQEYSVNILADATVQAFLKDENGDRAHAAVSNELRVLMMRYTNYDRYIKDIYLVDNQEGIYGNNLEPGVRTFIEKHMPDIRQSQGAAIWSSAYSKDTVVMYRIIHDTTYDLNRKIGALFIMMDVRMFTDVAARFMDSSYTDYCLTDAYGYLQIGSALPQGSSLDGLPPEYLTCSVAANDWTLTTWLQKATVYQPVNSLIRILVAGFLGSLAVVIMLIIFISSRITKPISELQRAMIRFGQGDLKVSVRTRRMDEIGLLSESMNTMIWQINAYIQQNEAHQRRQRALELKTLQYQINPHFLYNTLDSIHMIALKNGDTATSELVTSLSKLFRIALNHGHDFVTVSNEIEYVTHYLNIQSIRFPGQFVWRIDAEEGLLSYRILKFLLQPLAENSINHGLSSGLGDGEIHIRAALEEDFLVLSVWDNGIGMTEERLLEVRRLIQEPDVEEDPDIGGQGLRNVHQRLLLYYGTGLTIDSVWEEGTTIRLRIPLNQIKPDTK